MTALLVCVAPALGTHGQQLQQNCSTQEVRRAVTFTETGSGGLVSMSHRHMTLVQREAGGLLVFWIVPSGSGQVAPIPVARAAGSLLWYAYETPGPNDAHRYGRAGGRHFAQSYIARRPNRRTQTLNSSIALAASARRAQRSEGRWVGLS